MHFLELFDYVLKSIKLRTVMLFPHPILQRGTVSLTELSSLQ